MKMTRNRKMWPFWAFGVRSAPAAVVAVVAVVAAGALPAVPALAQAGGDETLAIELNKLEPQGDACRAYLVVKNAGDQALDSLKLDLVMFDKGGVVAKRLAVQAAPLPVGKTSLKVFDIAGHGCETIGSILLNDVLECAPAPDSSSACLASIAVSARGELKFLK